MNNKRALSNHPIPFPGIIATGIKPPDSPVESMIKVERLRQMRLANQQAWLANMTPEEREAYRQRVARDMETRQIKAEPKAHAKAARQEAALKKREPRDVLSHSESDASTVNLMFGFPGRKT